ncbi:replication initiation negative regulator SeqA [Shewanella sp. Isolate7]|uniref:replication initiation negative regulator SeqA n=1 Tax=Shewanella sp. Isolate7 TaxID=2908528 RepID=UPI001EFD1A98|nr:replication initiation negative regulator SeqA [Shewanella sp. Isolate7]MCG9721692.1 replication initiation negative regulator SeqA [Shewanella sp. Isolate7]
MKYIEIDEELYRHIASKTERIGESASEILRRLLGLDVETVAMVQPAQISQPGLDKEVAQSQQVASLDADTLIDKAALAQQKGAVGRFLFTLEAIYKATPNQFDQVLQIQGRDRLYFATSKESLLKASKSANPKEIGNSGFWVTTNNNTAKKRTILSEVLGQFGVQEKQIESIIGHI